MKREGELKQKFAAELKRQVPNYIVQLMASNGSPDRSITGDGRTTFWEMKHATPDFVSHGDQELMAMRLAVQGYCRYVVWFERGMIRKTMIVHPKQVYNRKSWDLIPEAFCVGFDMRWLVEQVRRAHDAYTARKKV